jgi:hypothetical protein
MIYVMNGKGDVPILFPAAAQHRSKAWTVDGINLCANFDWGDLGGTANAFLRTAPIVGAKRIVVLGSSSVDSNLLFARRKGYHTAMLNSAQFTRNRFDSLPSGCFETGTSAVHAFESEPDIQSAKRLLRTALDASGRAFFYHGVNFEHDERLKVLGLKLTHRRNLAEQKVHLRLSDLLEIFNGVPRVEGYIIWEADPIFDAGSTSLSPLESLHVTGKKKSRAAKLHAEDITIPAIDPPASGILSAFVLLTQSTSSVDRPPYLSRFYGSSRWGRFGDASFAQHNQGRRRGREETHFSPECEVWRHVTENTHDRITKEHMENVRERMKKKTRAAEILLRSVKNDSEKDRVHDNRRVLNADDAARRVESARRELMIHSGYAGGRILLPNQVPGTPPFLPGQLLRQRGVGSTRCDNG